MRNIHIAIVGAGVWGETHASIFREHPSATPVAVCDRDVARAKKLADAYGIQNVYGSVEEMLSADGFDAVSIVTPDHLHADIAVACANAGKHLLIEKPIATSVQDVHRIVNAARANHIRVMVDLHNRWSPPFRRRRPSSPPGRSALRSAYIKLNDPNGATDMPWAPARPSVVPGNHSLDTLQWLFGDIVTRVYCCQAAHVLDAPGRQNRRVPDHWSSNSGIAQMENGWITPNANPCVNDIKCT